MQSLVPIVWAISVLTYGIDAFSNTDIPRPQWRHWAANKGTVTKEYMEWKNSEAGKQAMDNELWGDSKHPTDPEATLNERVRRFYLSKLRVEELQRQNPDAQFTTDTPFAIMNPQEFEKLLGRSFSALNDLGGADNVPRFRRSLSEEVESSREPMTKDWTSSGCVSSVKTQGYCGSCWAFVAVSALESAYCIKHKILPSLSVEQVVGCSTANRGCDGGWSSKALEYIQQQGGLCRNDSTPDWTSTRKPQCIKSCNRFDITIKKVEHARLTESELLKAIDSQPVGTGDVWMHYKGGIVSSCTATKVTHAVLAVGYGIEFGKGTVNYSQRYIKLKNSWGPGWGENGYIRLRLGTGINGTCSQLVAPMSYPVL